MKIFKKIAPHLVAIAVFITLSTIYFSPMMNDYVLKQSDIKQFRGMQKEILDANLVNKEQTLWTNSMFGGMPSYQISAGYPNNIVTKIDQIIKLGLKGPIGILFMAMLGFYIFALCMKINPWLGIVGAVGFGFSTINILYIGAGHVTKVNAIAYMAPALGGLILAFRGKMLLGGIIFALFFSLNLTANHLQMTYYLSFLLAAVALAEAIRLMIKKEFLQVGKIGLVLIIGAIIGILPTVGNLATTLEYSKYTTRGSSDLTIKAEGANVKSESEGLNKNYILEYNYGKRELLSIIAPNAKGERGDYIGNDEELMLDVDSQYAEQIAKMNRYWGGQRMSGGAFYFGVVMLVFALFGVFFIKDSLKWPFVIIAILTLFLATNNPGGMNDFFINKIPLYNKFRDSKMILVLLQITIPAMGILFLNTLFFNKECLTGNKKTWLISSGVLIFVFILLYAIPSLSGNFFTPDELNQFADAFEKNKDPQQQEFLSGLQSALKDVRIEIYKSDFGRAIFLVLLGLGIILASAYSKISAFVLTVVSFVFVLGDNMIVAKRYLNNADLDEGNTHWEDITKSAYINSAEKADLSILDKESKNIIGFDAKVEQLVSKMIQHPNYENMDNSTVQQIAQFGVVNLNSDYRVLSFDNPFNETQTSYFHKSIGGYHGAKLKRYQEIIDFHISKEMQTINNAIGAEKNKKLREYASLVPIAQDQMQKVFDTISVAQINIPETAPVLNMLNTKYIMVNRSTDALENKNANGAAWFVDNLKEVKNSNEEMKGLFNLNTKKEAIVQSSFVKKNGIKSQYLGDSSASIKLVKYSPNELIYNSISKIAKPAIFSEIYYPKGWNCYVDDKLVSDFRANYVLRAAFIPAGNHQIVWKFEPYSYIIGSKISIFGSTFLVISAMLIFFFEIKINIANYK